MTMTHMGLPQVWKHLHHRTDITHLLHEILGQYTMSTYEKPTATIHDHTVHLFVQFRIIFDIQRTYLQARFPSAVSQSYLIPAPELFSSIRYLDQIRSELYGKISDTDKESLELRFFAARGLLSGLRALVLLESRLPSTDVDELHESVRIWCWKAKGNTIETFILEKCIYLLKQISQYSSSDEKFQVRKLSTGGQFGDLRKRANENFLRELKQLRKGDENAFWALFDLLWAAETDFLQASVEPLSHTDTEISHYQVDNLCELLDDSNEAELCLKKVVLEWCDEDAVSYPQSHRRSTSKSHITSTEYRSTRESIKDFRIFLERRQSRILDMLSKITHLDSELEDSLKSWYHDASKINDLELSYNEALRIGRLDDFRTEISCTYILNCPQLHVLPWFCLKSLMSGDETRCIGEEPTFVEFQTAVRCPQCKVAKYIRSARKIEPVHRISTLLEEQVRKTQFEVNDEEVSVSSSPSTLFSQAPSSPPLSEAKRRSFASLPERKASSSTEGSINMVKSNKSWKRRFSSGINLTKRKSFTDISPVSKAPTKVLQGAENIIWSHGFSADSKDIILWDKEGGHIFASSVPIPEPAETAETWKWRKYDFPGVRLATGAEGRVVGVSETSRLSVFSEPGSAAILDIQLKEGSAVRSIAISSQGESVAVGFDNCFLVYEIAAGNKAAPTTRQPLDTNPKSHFNSQRLNFSRDGTKLIVATRKTQNLQGRVELNFHDELDPTKTWRRLLDPASLPNNDLGLSAVFFDNHVKRAIVAGFISKPYHVVHSMFSGEVWSTSRGPNSDRRFQAAAQSPTGSKFTFVNAGGYLFQLDLRQKQPALQDLGTRLDSKNAPKSPDDFISVAMPDDKTTYAFWIENRMGVLNTIHEGGKPTRRNILLPDIHFAKPSSEE